MSSRREMHPHRQTPSARDSPPRDHLSPYGQMPPHGYVNNPFTSNMTPNNQVYGGPPTNFPPPHPSYPMSSTSSQIYGGTFADDQHQHHAMAFPGPLAPSQLSPQSSSAYSADYRQRSFAPSTDNSPTQNVSQYFHGANPQNQPFQLPTSINSPYVSSSNDMLLLQASSGQDQSSLRSASIAASTNGDACRIGTTKEDVNADESFCSDSTPLRTIAQQAGVIVNLQDDGPSTHLSAHQQQGSQGQMDEHHMMKKPQPNPSMSDIIEVGQKPFEEPVVGTSETLSPCDQQSALPQPIMEPDFERQDTEDGSTSQPYLSLDSKTSGSDDEEEEDSDQEKTDGENQQVATTLQSEDDLDKVDKYAFNFSREAYDHHVPQQLTKGVTLHVSSLAPLTTTLKQRRDDVNNDVTPTLLPKPNEYQKGPKTVECVWVGVLPSSPAMLQIQSKLDQPSEAASTEGDSKKPTRKRNLKKTFTVSGIRDDEMKVIAFDQEALRVVAKKSDKITKEIHIYALIQPQNTSILQGFKVGFDDVFYFRDFRDDTAVSIMRRKQATVAKIKASVFRGVSHAVSQSPAPTAEHSMNQPHHALTALSPLSSLSSMATPTPPPGNLTTQKHHVARPSRKLSTSGTIHRASSLSQLTSNKEATGEESTESRKRKAQDPLFDILMKQREKARKRARAEGYYVPGSDSEIHESVEDDEQKSPADPTQDCDISMRSVSDYSEDAGELADHGSSTSHDVRMHMSSQYDDDEEGCPEHAVRRHDPSFVNYTNGLIDQVAFEKTTAGKAPQEVSFRLQSGQVIDKCGKAVSPTDADSDNHDSDDEGQSSRARPRNSAVLSDKIKSFANKLATDQDVIGLQQALTMIECIRNRRGPSKTSALSLYFNVSNKVDIEIEDCAEQLDQLRVSTNDPPT